MRSKEKYFDLFYAFALMPGLCSKLQESEAAYAGAQQEYKSFELMDKTITIKDATYFRGFQVNYMDTKANLLYKLGHKQEVITQEEALDLARNLKNDYLITNFTATIVKMKKTEPTWPSPQTVGQSQQSLNFR